ncbi:hypothetical protein BDZ90DRAFT_229656 [Jaminaea rosea]|uniref:Zn(2)-C6 fungal-type domain-containing protein n=1 Tax=Jaminaea rosea TaxID=1569628 RepID=A0A316V080_9BASI|nr:hypothetical protein BDZ90DRAFT_229656 [Jaminaea rosea]PWN30644.1 hypothetical protein BDZ90DRAFT_229656 [Jaminaea rosea]
MNSSNGNAASRISAGPSGHGGGGAASNHASSSSPSSQDASNTAWYPSAAHPNDLPSNVINAYSGSFSEYAAAASAQQQQQQQQQSQQHQQDHAQPATNLPLLPDSDAYNHHQHDHHQQSHDDGNHETHQGHDQQHDQHQVEYDETALALQEGEASMADYTTADATTGDMSYADESLAASGLDDDNGGEGGGDGSDGASGSRPKKKARSAGSGRVAKACQPCSSKKRRCDGTRPECRVCAVLGTPCSYTTTGLKRGPPKGFRAGPKESVKAKLTRTLETTIRDLVSQLGGEDAAREIARVSRERGLPSLPSEVSATDAALVVEALAQHSHADLGVTQRAIQSSLAQHDDDTFLGVNERGDLSCRGSSSGIQLLRRANSPPTISSPGSSERNKRGNEPMLVNLPTAQQSYVRPQRMQEQLLNQLSPQNQFKVPSSSTAALFDDPIVTPEESHKLFDNYWRSWHPYWPILYKAILDEIPPEEMATRLDGLLLNAIYAIGSSGRANSGQPIEGESPEEAARRSGEVFAQAAERRLFATGLRPTVTAIQASFMLSLFAHGTGELSRAWSFCGIAINMAMDLGLHRWPIHRMDLLDNSAERETRTRTIWSLYILDKILCAEMGRAPILRAREMDPPLLSEDTPDEMEYMDGAPMRIPSVFNAAVHCFAIVERILSEVHSLRRKAVLRRGQTTPDILTELDGELEKFRNQIPDPIKVPTDGSRPKVGFPGIVWALGVWDATATILLHRPFIPQETDGNAPSYEEVVANPSHQKASHAADRLCELLQLDMGQRGGDYDVALWPSDYAYCLFTAAVMYLFNARLGVAGARQKFALARDHLKQLASRWPAASAHRQLLDGFTAVADDALGRPETSSGEPTALGGAYSIEEWTAQTITAAQAQQSMQAQQQQQQPHQQAQMPDENGSSSAPAAMGPPITVPGPGSDLSEEQRQQLLSFYMDSSHPFGQQGNDASQQRRRLDSFAPGLFDVETAFWNESAGSTSSLSNAFANMVGQGQQAQQGGEGGSGSQQHNGLAMLAALAPHAAPQQQQQQQQHQQQQHQQQQQGDGGESDQKGNFAHNGQGPEGQQQGQQQHGPLQQHQQGAAGHGAQASPFAFPLDPSQPAWNDPLMGALELGPAYK